MDEMDGLEHWFKPRPRKAAEKTRLERQVEIIRRVRKRLVNQRWAINCLERAYVEELRRGEDREKSIAALRASNVDLACRLFDAEQRLDQPSLLRRIAAWFGM